MRADTDGLAGMGLCGYRAWANWDRPDGDASAFRSDGSVREDLWAGLVEALDYAAAKGLRVDVTFNGETFADLAAHQRAVRTALERLRGHPAVWIVDVCNECEFEGESYWRALVSTARAADPLRLVTISFSGDPADVSARYARLRDVLDLATPHWPREDGWEDALAPLSLSVERQSGLPVHAQEEARQGYEGDSFPVSAYVDACRAACDAGLLGYTQHTEAGFYADRGSLIARLDPVTRAALTEQGRDRCGCVS
jgi:antitoxin (DNA-binding transcriptional repressor) of toxin-antitoxin stability system